MNNYRLSTFKRGATKLNRDTNIYKSLLDKVLKMEDIYVRDDHGLRIIASNRTLVKKQLFYILAEGPKENIRGSPTLSRHTTPEVFKDSKACAQYFGVTSQTINDRLAKGSPILNTFTKIEFILSRRPVISRDETFKKGRVV
jgi:hypothetical protein